MTAKQRAKRLNQAMNVIKEEAHNTFSVSMDTQARKKIDRLAMLSKLNRSRTFEGLADFYLRIMTAYAGYQTALDKIQADVDCGSFASSEEIEDFIASSTDRESSAFQANVLRILDCGLQGPISPGKLVDAVTKNGTVPLADASETEPEDIEQ